MTFFTQYDRPPLEDFMEVNNEPSMTETAGYIPTERLIETFVEAGIKLEITRNFEFPGDEEVPEDYEAINFGSRLDALMLSKDVKERLNNFLAAKKAEQAKAEAIAAEVAAAPADGGK